ncbi:lysozyme M1 (1,4-beta-N-acetylmuramidase) [Aciduliprofundum sp. MAR08-339]|uniref:GH25 family lysozyme n=1 Tax=Aciduliprofundum sp. (strain MAR08-339) TaxID=673860 RepID=UPI0002A49282|nr:lysozyme M1 (1,4-beta-N-acetylmuramidase) [Aciduliprofundum sp. MAR08-339]
MKYKSAFIALVGVAIMFATIFYGLTLGQPNAVDYNYLKLKVSSTSERVYGVDVSHWQGEVNWQEVYNDGYRFAFVKATQGTSYVDSEFTTNMKNGHAAGLYMGAYHFAEPNTPIESDADQEADHFVNTISPYLKDGYLVPVLDLEDNSNDLTWTQLTDWANAFCSRVYNETGIRPLIYTSSSWAENLAQSITQWDLWIAEYTGDTSEEPNTGVWPSWSFWQYTDSGSVNGISGNVDEDIFNGNLETLEDEYVIHQVSPQPLYDHRAAYGYAYKWWSSSNPHYALYSNSSDESANFVSQALIAGGLSLWKGDDGSGGGLGSSSYGALPSCEALHKNLVEYQDVDYAYVTSQNFSVPEDLEVGDVVIFGNEDGEHWSHAAIVVYRSGNDVGIAMHDPDVWNASLSSYFPSTYSRISYYHIEDGAKKLIQPFKVIASALNVRVGPSTSYQILGTIKKGQVYVAYNYYMDSSGRRWWEIFYDDRVAWCASWYTENVSYGVFRVDVGTYLHVRGGPGTGYSVFGEVYDGMLFARIGQDYNGTEGITWYEFWWSSTSSWCASQYTEQASAQVPEFPTFPFVVIFLFLILLLFRKKLR